MAAEESGGKTLEERICRIEDRLEIYNLIASHPPSADTGAGDYTASVWTEDGVFDRGAEFPRPSGSFVDNPMARLVYAMLAGGSSYGAAFPSSHVAASVAATIAGWSASRRLGVVLLVLTALLTVAVVYCQMHYAVDALAGLGVGLGVGGWAVKRER